ncbi:MAG: hypothetical protein NC928_04035, partial [Candidatus Omnitrophica bacterium]|nr:hypothetical protein [Candidatus Omnitrophota bacterium]
GLEDYEYLYILKEKLEWLKKNKEGNQDAIIKIEECLSIPFDVVRSAAYFTRQPEKIYELRNKIAELIQAH